MNRSAHTLTLGPISRELPLFEVKPGLAIAVLNILGDVELTETAAAMLAERLAERGVETIVTPEAKSIPLAYALARILELPYVVLRKTYKSYMGRAISGTTESITTGHEQTLYLDAKDCGRIAERRIAIVDDVVSTGSTLATARELIGRAGGDVVAEAAICTEGRPEDWAEVIALGHLPLFETTRG